MRHPQLLGHSGEPGLVARFAWKASMSGACPSCFIMHVRVFRLQTPNPGHQAPQAGHCRTSNEQHVEDEPIFEGNRHAMQGGLPVIQQALCITHAALVKGYEPKAAP